MALYLVSYSWHEEYDPTLVEGPAVDDWKGFCDSLLPKAAKRALAAEDASWIGWDVIKDALVGLLVEQHGYAVVEPPEAMYWGTIIIDDSDEARDEAGRMLLGDAEGEVIKHNSEVRNGLHEEMENKE